MVFGINSSHIVNRKEIVLGFASHYFTPSYLQCLHYLSQIPQPAILLHICKFIPIMKKLVNVAIHLFKAKMTML